MNDNKTKISADKLYERYQETRDNIPLSTFQAISMATESAHHEQAIHTIAQAAKVASAASLGDQTEKKSSWFTTVTEMFKTLFTQNGLSKPIGISFACLAIIAAIGPLFLSNTANPYFLQKVAHLDNCVECETHIRNALATTRGYSTASMALSAASRHDAKLGVIQGRLQVETAYGDRSAVDNAILALNKLDKSRFSASLNIIVSNTETSGYTVKPEALSLAISNSVNDRQVGTASTTIFIANISARNALKNDSLEPARASFLAALTAMQNLTARSPLQETATSKLEATASTPEINLRKAIKNLEFAARSLGG
jgi:hypothetical protein